MDLSFMKLCTVFTHFSNFWFSVKCVQLLTLPSRYMLKISVAVAMSKANVTEFDFTIKNVAMTKAPSMCACALCRSIEVTLSEIEIKQSS